MRSDKSIFGHKAEDVGDLIGGVCNKGFRYIADTDTHTPPEGYIYKKIRMITATVFATLTPEAEAPVDGTITGVTLPVNFELEGAFNVIDLTSGSVVAYYGLK